MIAGLWAISTVVWALCCRALPRWAYGVVVIIMLALSVHRDVLSDDAYRYRWDGWVTSHGVNPYTHVPQDSTIDHLAFTTEDGIVYPDVVPYGHMHTIYPPGAQIILGSITLFSSTNEMVFKLIWWAIIMVLLFAVIRLLDDHHRTLFLVAISCPVILFHGIMDIHLDMIMALLTVLSVILNSKGRPFLASGILGFAITVKFLPVLALPILLRARSWDQRLKLLGVMCAVVALVYVPFFGAGVFGSLSTFAQKWQSNSALYSLLRVFFDDGIVRIVMAGMGLAGLIKIWWMYRAQPLFAMTSSIIVILLCSPVVHPWYLIMPLLMLPFAPLRSTLVWGATICVYGIAYTNYKGDGVWLDHPIALACEFLPVVVALVIDMRRGPLLFRDEHRVNSIATS
ncbi:MAG: DUF2029 domain-containing protein [Ignavibacteria bacterium]|nr:DUF2029 domain-containing protein [Ignavibacteria bacterium]